MLVFRFRIPVCRIIFLVFRLWIQAFGCGVGVWEGADGAVVAKMYNRVGRERMVEISIWSRSSGLA